MAQPLVPFRESSDSVQSKPWAYRAAGSPRRTYSAESKIVYKRRKHKFTLVDLERIQKLLMGEISTSLVYDGTIGERLFQGMIKWMERTTLKLLTEMFGYLIPDFAIESVYNFIRSIGAAIIANGGLQSRAKNEIQIAWNAFIESLWKGLAGRDIPE